MNKDQLIGLSLVGSAFMGLGALVGGYIVKKIDDRHETGFSTAYESVAKITYELWLKERDDRTKLEKELETLKKK